MKPGCSRHPCGSPGKSTVAKIVAGKKSYIYIDTGAMYRAITYLALKKGVDLNDEAALTALLKESAIDLTVSPEGEQKVYIAGEDVADPGVFGDD